MDGIDGGRPVKETMAVIQLRRDKHGLNYSNKKGGGE